MPKRKDDRPICDCRAYLFPHRVGGKCDGSTFAEWYWYNTQAACGGCNCNRGDECDVVTGAESIKLAECYIEAEHRYPGEHLKITWFHNW